MNKKFLDLYEELSNLFENKNELLATEEDWDKFFLNKLPESIEFDDLEAEVEYTPWDKETGFNSMTDTVSYNHHDLGKGYINNYTYFWKPTNELFGRFFHKPFNKITAADLLNTNADDFYSFLLNDNEIRKAAQEEAQKEWDAGNIDEDEVDWLADKELFNF